MISVLLLLAAVQPAAASAPPAETEAEPPAKAERKICRSYVETGSLTRRTKVCRTAAEWSRNEQEYRANARSYQDAVNSTRTQ